MPSAPRVRGGACAARRALRALRAGAVRRGGGAEAGAPSAAASGAASPAENVRAVGSAAQASSASRIARRTPEMSSFSCSKRTSSFAGWAFTSTRAGSTSRLMTAKGYSRGGRMPWNASATARARPKNRIQRRFTRTETSFEFRRLSGGRAKKPETDRPSVISFRKGISFPASCSPYMPIIRSSCVAAGWRARICLSPDWRRKPTPGFPRARRVTTSAARVTSAGAGHAGALPGRSRGDADNVPRLDKQLAPLLRARQAGGDGHAADRGHARQRLPPEAEGGDAENVVDVSDFRGCVALEAGDEIRLVHAVPVVRDADGAVAAP